MENALAQSVLSLYTFSRNTLIKYTENFLQKNFRFNLAELNLSTRNVLPRNDFLLKNTYSVKQDIIDKVDLKNTSIYSDSFDGFSKKVPIPFAINTEEGMYNGVVDVNCCEKSGCNVRFEIINDVGYSDRMFEIQQRTIEKLNKENNGYFIYNHDKDYFLNSIKNENIKIIGAFGDGDERNELIAFIFVNNTKGIIEKLPIPKNIQEKCDAIESNGINYSGSLMIDPLYSEKYRGIGKFMIGKVKEISKESGYCATVSLISCKNIPSIFSSIRNDGYICKLFLDPEDGTWTYLMFNPVSNEIKRFFKNEVRYMCIKDNMKNEDFSVLDQTTKKYFERRSAIIRFVKNKDIDLEFLLKNYLKFTGEQPFLQNKVLKNFLNDLTCSSEHFSCKEENLLKIK